MVVFTAEANVVLVARKCFLLASSFCVEGLSLNMRLCEIHYVVSPSLRDEII